MPSGQVSENKTHKVYDGMKMMEHPLPIVTELEPDGMAAYTYMDSRRDSYLDCTVHSLCNLLQFLYFTLHSISGVLNCTTVIETAPAPPWKEKTKPSRQEPHAECTRKVRGNDWMAAKCLLEHTASNSNGKKLGKKIKHDAVLEH